MNESSWLFLTSWWQELNWSTWLLVPAYLLSIVMAVLIILQNRNPSKTLGYIVLLLALPYLGVIIYFVFGENYRKKKIYKRKLVEDARTLEIFNNYLAQLTRETLQAFDTKIANFAPLVKLLLRESRVPLTVYNKVNILVNGEEKYPAVLEALETASSHIHLEYYIFEEGEIAEAIAEILIRKSREGVIVRLIYDDFGSDLGKDFLRRLKEGGVKAIPFYKIYFPLLSNRHNYRNHHKLVIVDGKTGFIGGINISDRYDNRVKENPCFWRDTHLRIYGDSVKMMQALFLVNWNFCADDFLTINQEYFPDLEEPSEQLTQIVYSGPDSDRATIMLSYFTAINCAKEYIYITTPYFIPNESILNALKTAAFSGVDVRLIVPGVSDSKFVNMAASSYYEELLEAGVRIFLYQKGFVHAKTMVCDNRLSMVGSSNMDIRSFDLNFEVNAVVYDEGIAASLAAIFYKDEDDSEEITLEGWRQRPKWRRWAESGCRIFSSVL